MLIELSASNELRRWLNLDAPMLTQPGSQALGAQAISSSEDSVSWQCHVISHQSSQAQPFHTVVAVQARSEYVLLIPYLNTPTPEQLAGDLIYRWGNELMHRMVDSGSIERKNVEVVAEHFNSTPREWHWYLNTDPLLQPQAEAAQQWVSGYMDAFGLEHLEEDHAIDLGAHINAQSVKGTDFEPDDKALKGFVADGLFRFAFGLCPNAYENTSTGDFPWPWGAPPKLLEPNTGGGSNLVSLKDFRNR